MDFQLKGSPLPYTWSTYINGDDGVKEFSGVIGQDGELIHIRDFVELSYTHEEVCFRIRVSRHTITSCTFNSFR